MRKFFSILLGLLLAPFILYFGYGGILIMLGYELTGSPEKLVAKLIEENRPAKDCFLFRTLDPLFRPTTRDLQNRCIYVYSEEKKDPSACELLMPSSYGLSCVGGARGNYECNFYEKNEVSWVEGNVGKKATFRECAKPDPQRSQRGNECCTVAFVTRVKTNNDCSSLSSNQMMFDECQYRLSFKNHDPSSCEPIQDPTIKTACIVSVKALQKDPSICTGCTPPVESIEELPE